MVYDYKKITQQFGVSYLFTFLSFLFSPILVFLLTRTLTVIEYGVYSILAATISVLSTVLVLGLPQYIVTKLTGLKYFKKIKIIFSIIFFELFFLMIVLAILFIPLIQNNILLYLKLESYKLEFQLSLLIILFAALLQIFLYYLIANRKIEFKSFISFLGKCLWILFLILFFLISKKVNLPIVFFLWLIGAIISLLILILYLRKDVFFFFLKIKKLSKSLLKNALFFSLPLIPVTISSWIMTVADRYMITYFKNMALTGIYSLSYALVFIIFSFSIIISNVLYPYISKSWSEKKDSQILFNAMLKYNLMIILPAMTGLFILRKQIITLISGTNYLLGSSAIAILISFPLFASLIEIYTRNLMLRKKTKLLAFIYLGGAILNIVLNLFMIPLYGINGASITTVASYFFMFLIFHLVSKKYFLWDFKFLRIKKILFASFLMGLIIFLINPQIYITKIVSIFLGILIYILLLFLFKVFVKEEYLIMKSFIPKKDI
jgi:O-antigen/teichoic acid export membrane protein